MLKLASLALPFLTSYLVSGANYYLTANQYSAEDYLYDACKSGYEPAIVTDRNRNILEKLMRRIFIGPEPASAFVAGWYVSAGIPMRANYIPNTLTINPHDGKRKYKVICEKINDDDDVEEEEDEEEEETKRIRVIRIGSGKSKKRVKIVKCGRKARTLDDDDDGAFDLFDDEEDTPVGKVIKVRKTPKKKKSQKRSTVRLLVPKTSINRGRIIRADSKPRKKILVCKKF